MKKSAFILFITIGFLSIFSFSAFADFMLLAWNQAQENDIQGWRLYYAVHAEGEVPDPPVSVTEYDGMLELEAFEFPGEFQIPRPQIYLPEGLTVRRSDPAGKDRYWESTYRFYAPPISEKEKYYMILTVYDFDGNVSRPSDIITFTANPPGTTGTPVTDDDL